MSAVFGTLALRVCAVPEEFKLCMCQAPWTSNRPQGSAYDKGSCTEEPRDRETVTRGFEVEAGAERPLPTITYSLGGDIERGVWIVC